MELFNLINSIAYQDILGCIRHNTSVREIETNESSAVLDQRAFINIERSVFLYTHYLDENEIERNIRWRLTCNIDVWVDQVVCAKNGEILSAELDEELFLANLKESRPEMYFDDSKVHDYEFDEIELLQQFTIKADELDEIKKIIQDVYVRKHNSKFHYIAKALMKDNGEVFSDYYDLYSDKPLSTDDHYHEVFKSIALDTPYGVCQELLDHKDPITGKLSQNFDSSEFKAIDVDFELGYSLIQIDIIPIDDFDYDRTAFHELHFLKELNCVKNNTQNFSNSYCA